LDFAVMLPLPSEARFARLFSEGTHTKPISLDAFRRFLTTSSKASICIRKMSDYYERSRLYWRRRAARQGVSEAEFDRTHADDIEFMEDQATFAARDCTNTSAPRDWIIHRALYYTWKVLGK
jgi:hypothetical protein